MNKISIIVPAYNEAENLPDLVEQVENAIVDDFEIIIVNDGSSDKSAELIKKLEIRYNTVKSHHIAKRSGKTSAIVKGFEISNGEIIVVLDADLQYLPKDIPKLVKLLDAADVVNGLRINRKDNIVRLFESKLYNLIHCVFFNVQFKDSNSGLKVFKREVLECILPIFRPRWHRFFLTVATEKGFKVVEKGIIHYPRTKGVTKFTSSPLKLLKGFVDLLNVKLSV